MHKSCILILKNLTIFLFLTDTNTQVKKYICMPKFYFVKIYTLKIQN